MGNKVGVVMYVWYRQGPNGEKKDEKKGKRERKKTRAPQIFGFEKKRRLKIVTFSRTCVASFPYFLKTENPNYTIPHTCR
jgi:hypothetical protein